MSWDRSTHFFHDIITAMHKMYLVMRCTCALNAPREIVVEESEIVEAWEQPLRDPKSDVDSIVIKEDIVFEGKECELDSDRAQPM